MAPLPDPSHPEPTQILFRRYRIMRELGRGGMGVVYLAIDSALDVPVAIKLIPDMVARDTDAVVDLRKEVLRGMSLAHPGVVRTHHFERDESGAAIVMEYVEGETLNEFRQRQPLGCCNPDAILPWLDQLASVLDYAHRGPRLVHRDLKPRNIMLTKEGQLKVADFGIAAVLSDSMTRHSMEGKVSGTLGYMSPQQAQGSRPTSLDDIYSVGATLYDLLTGKPPFFRGNPAAILAQISTVVPPSVAERREELGVEEKSGLPPVWEEVISACLAKDPAQRPQTVAEIVERLRKPEVATATALAPPALPPPARMRSLPPVPPLHPPLPPPPVYASTPPPTASRGGAKMAIAVVALIIILSLIGAGVYFATQYKGLGRPSSEPGAPGRTNPLAGVPAETPSLSQATPIPKSTAPKVQIVATRDRPFVNSLGMRFVPAGTRDVLMSIWETRKSDFAPFAAANPGVVRKGLWLQKATKNPKSGTYSFINTWLPEGTWQNPGFQQADDHPVVGRDLHTARLFCRWLTTKEQAAGLLPADAFYAIPTDDEWTTAAGRATYPWGDSTMVPSRAGNYWDSAAVLSQPAVWPNPLNITDGAAYTAPVGSYEPNAYGIYDLGGNVWEWNDSIYDPARQSAAYLKAVEGSTLPFDVDGLPWRIARGGSWYSDRLSQAEVATRAFESPNVADAQDGFRVVLVLTPRTSADFRRRAQLEGDWDFRPPAAADYARVLELDSTDFHGLMWRALSHASKGRYAESRADMETGYRIHGRYPGAINALAWLLATCPDGAIRDGNRAVQLATEACQATRYKSAVLLDTLAAAYAEMGNWKMAVAKEKEAIALLDKTDERVAECKIRLDLYQAQKPFRDFPRSRGRGLCPPYLKSTSR